MEVTLGAVRYLSQYDTAYPMSTAYSSYDYAWSAGLTGAEMMSTPPITAGSFAMSAQVSVTYTTYAID